METDYTQLKHTMQHLCQYTIRTQYAILMETDYTPLKGTVEKKMNNIFLRFRCFGFDSEQYPSTMCAENLIQIYCILIQHSEQSPDQSVPHEEVQTVFDNPNPDRKIAVNAMGLQKGREKI